MAGSGGIPEPALQNAPSAMLYSVDVHRRPLPVHRQPGPIIIGRICRNWPPVTELRETGRGRYAGGVYSQSSAIPPILFAQSRQSLAWTP
jgi:hypothetical protein